ncbi:SLATT domain-containing protein [Pseudomonas citronellolis]|uniref:SLATT domain-containing protein n=1 Tax=Pseudomonas citronellolis TaxID=53408 RepID=UPI002649D04B|nr:SLATT domain-containing protein [Pseudomonas citronellolis]MDN6874485.1 SLATT domain-containing protein [Pseudomonas citronellolis]
MDKALFLKGIAETGYNVGFGGRKHWATYDIVDKVPGLIGFGSMAIGIFALIYDQLSAKSLSAAILVIGLMGLYISFYDHKKAEYEKAANSLTALYNRLRDLYRDVKSSPAVDQRHQDALAAIEQDYYSVSLSKQILFSDWYAHYKFFWQYQIDWVNEQKSFTLWRDKLPLSLVLWGVGLLCLAIYLYAKDTLLFVACSVRHLLG